VAIHEVRCGAIPVVLADAEGHRFQVDLVRRADSSEQAVAFAGTAALYLANRGNGSKDTHEEHGLGVMALADALRAEDGSELVPTSLMTFAARRERHPLGSYRVS